MSLALPDRKVRAGGVSSVLAWALMVIASRYGYPVPADMQATLVILVGYAVAYFVPPSQQDILKRLNDAIVQSAMDDPNIPVTKR